MNQASLIGIRLLSIYIILSGLNAIINILATSSQWERGIDSAYLMMQFLGFFLPLITGILLWVFSKKLAGLVADAEPTEPMLLSDEDFVRAGTFLIGVYIVIMTISPLYFAVVQYQELDYGMDKTTVLRAIKHNSMELTLGILLIVGQRFIVNAYSWLRTAGSQSQ